MLARPAVAERVRAPTLDYDSGVDVPVGRIIFAALVFLAGIGVPGLPPVAAQDEPERERGGRAADFGVAAQSTLAGEPRGTAAHQSPARYFFDDFSDAALNRRDWESSVGVTPTRELLDGGEPVGAVRLAWDPQVTDRLPQLCGVPVSLAGVPGAELAFTVQYRGVEAGERLTVEYLAADGRWNTIERVVADGSDSAEFSRVVRVLPVEALHDGFRVCFRAGVDDEDDAWYLGEVSVAGYDPLRTLTVHLHPPRDAHVELVLAGRSDGQDFSVPFTRRFPVGARVHLVPPPTVDEWVFSHWSVARGAGRQRQRVLTLEMTEEIDAVAHYRPWVSGRNEVSVAIVSTPLAGVQIALGTEPELLFTHVSAATEYPSLTGEWLTLLAPLRTERMVFVGWVVNGENVPGGDNLLEHRVGGDDVLLAQYVLLGDVNDDDLLDKFDVDLFVAALVDPFGYAEAYPELDRIQRCDVNGDGVVDALDLEGFVDLLLHD